MDLNIIYAPCVSKDEAMNISEALVEKGLIVCANIHDSTSVYRWEGKTEMQPESIIVAKATEEKTDGAVALIKEMHSYDVPAILTWKAGSRNRDYDDWVTSS